MERGPRCLREWESFRTGHLRRQDATPGPGKQCLLFPGIGLGAVASRARTLPDDLFLAAARTLAGLVRQDDLDDGSLYPPLRSIRNLSLAIAVSVATKAYEMKLAREKRPKNIRRHIKALMYEP